MYTASIYFYDASNPNDIEDITPEIREEVNEHYILYEKAGVSNLTITSSASDISGSDGIPINMVTDWSTGGAESGNVVVHLIHEPTIKMVQLELHLVEPTMLKLTFLSQFSRLKV